MKKSPSKLTKLIKATATLQGRIIIASLIILFILLSSYLFIYQYHTYKTNLIATFTFFALFVSIFILVQICFPPASRKNLKTLIITLILWLSILFSIRKLHDNYFDRELKKNGEMTYGKVFYTGSWESKGTLRYYAVISYNINNKQYQQVVSNDDHFLKTDLILKVQCSSKDPDIFKIVGDDKHKPILIFH